MLFAAKELTTITYPSCHAINYELGLDMLCATSNIFLRVSIKICVFSIFRCLEGFNSGIFTIPYENSHYIMHVPNQPTSVQLEYFLKSSNARKGILTKGEVINQCLLFINGWLKDCQSMNLAWRLFALFCLVCFYHLFSKEENQGIISFWKGNVVTGFKNIMCALVFYQFLQELRICDYLGD